MRTPMRKQLTAAAVAMVLAGAALVSCGDDSGDDTAVVATPVSLPGKVTDKGTTDLGTATDLDLDIDDQYFAPTFIDAPAGATVRRLAVREIPRSGQPDELMDRYGISARHIVETVRQARAQN